WYTLFSPGPSRDPREGEHIKNNL
ncbi:orf351.CDS.1, partial (mitochondrion) [Saccharomyces cerevisiae]